MVVPISTRKLCFETLKINKDELLALVGDADSYYQPYLKHKRDEHGKIIKTRTIEPSDGYLKVVQRRINKHVLKPALDSLPPEIMGGRPGVSVIDNARFHSRSKALMKYDVKNFFPSIQYEHVYHIFRHRLNFCEEAANILTKLTTYPAHDAHVPQGVPTSTSLAMFSLEPLCIKLADYTRDNGMKFSIWVDDITISGESSTLKVHRGYIDHLVKSTPFKIHPDKDSGIVQKGAKVGGESGRRVTGVTIDNTNRLTLGHKKFKSLKRRVAHIKFPSENLLGSLQFLKQVSPSQGKKLVHEYRKNTGNTKKS